MCSGSLGVASARLSAQQQTGKADPSLQTRERTLELATQAGEGSTQAGGLKLTARSPPLNLHLSEERLEKALPLKGDKVVRLPIMLHSSEVRHTL